MKRTSILSPASSRGQGIVAASKAYFAKQSMERKRNCEKSGFCRRQKWPKRTYRTYLFMEKKLKFIIIFLFLFNYGYSQSFNVGALSYKNNNIIIDEEVVTFYDEYLSSKYILLNTSKEKVLLQMNIECVPESFGGGSYSESLIPLNFHIFENDKEIDFYVQNKDRILSKRDSFKERTSEVSSIIFELTFTPGETKKITIEYFNENHNCSYIFDTGWRKAIRYCFNSKSKLKIAKYIPNDKNLCADEGFCLLDFILRKQFNYVIETNTTRIYESNNFNWILNIPQEITEIICRQDYFNPLGLGDYAPYALLYKEAFFDLEEEAFLRFRNKNLSKEQLSKADLFSLSKKQLSILRNSFYAKYGYNFKNKDLRDYFEANCKAQGITYKINPNFSESIFNEVERKNIELIKEMENMKEPILLSDVQ